MKVLIVKTSSLGDIIHSFPVIRYLREKYPDVEIDWVVEDHFAELLHAHPLVDQIFRVSTKKWRRGRDIAGFIRQFRAIREKKYNLLFDLQGNTKSGLFTALARAEIKVGFGRDAVAEWPNLLTTHVRFCPPSGLNIRDEYLFLVQSYFKDVSSFKDLGVRLRISSEESGQIEKIPVLGKRNIMVCPGSRWLNKQMTVPALVRFLQTLPHPLDSVFFLIWGTGEEKMMAEEVVKRLPGQCRILDKMPIPMLQNLMDRMDLVVSMDSLPLHLAATTSCATVGIFGASSANKYAPVGKKHHFYQGVCPYGETFEKRCPKLRTCKTGACIRDLTGEELS